MNRARHRLQLWSRSRMLLLGLAALAVLFIVGSVLWAQLGQQQAQQQTGVVEQQRDDATAEKVSLAEQIKAECNAGGLDGPICERAADIAATPTPPAAGEPGRPPTAAEIQTAVDVYLTMHPPPAGRAPSAAEVAAAVASYLTANPPTPGRAPTAAEISDAVEGYFDRNPPPAGEPGENGSDGQPGRPPTAAEIRSAVDQHLAENPPPAGEDGERGPAGPPGPPPASYTMTFSDGTTQTCTRSGGDDSAPTYACTAPVPPPSDSGDENEGGLLNPP